MMPIELGFNEGFEGLVTRTEEEKRYQHARSSCSFVGPPSDCFSKFHTVECEANASDYTKVDPNEVYRGGYVVMKFRGQEGVVLFRG